MLRLQNSVTLCEEDEGCKVVPEGRGNGWMIQAQFDHNNCGTKSYVAVWMGILYNNGEEGHGREMIGTSYTNTIGKEQIQTSVNK